ncbi:MAG TPA: flagellar FliJ family protein [Sandaracinaceae bacterium LLY-WYZ-13_1]|nr:flagellar FliJ family protein [Sandaracinaceae bacterium LLY-WYZ-13_1]
MSQRDRITRIVRLKSRIRDARRGALADAEAHADDARSRVASADAEVVRLAEAYCRPGELNARELAHRASLVASAREGRRRAAERLEEAEAEAARRQAAVAEASREVRSLEVLDDRLAERERKDEARREQTESDERAARMGATG